MFNLQGGELIIILLLALVVLGPEKLPEAMRKAGQAYAELKKMSSGFQSEFRAAVDEPLREIRETANALRDSADFTKFQQGERDEKPKSAEMAPADADTVPVDAIPTFETPADGAGPTPAVDSEQAPFADESQGPQVPPPSGPITTRATFTGTSSTQPRTRDPEPEREAGDTSDPEDPAPSRLSGELPADGEPGTNR
ncbi:MAG: twin-arginine translocase TatA/TatE family subunit [Ilumatobacteraceae bacterium]